MSQVCKRCVMDNVSDHTIKFNKDGVCNYCSSISKRKETEYFPNDEGKRRLEGIVAEIKFKCKDDKYDCMVGVSGGIDSSYIVYLGYKFGLRMLAVHIDDGLDNPIAVDNIKKLVETTGMDYLTICPDREEYADILYSFFKASIPNLAIAQDNLIKYALQKYGEENEIKYILDGSNFAHESILEHDDKGVDNCDEKFILRVHERFGRVPIRKTEFMSLTDRYIKRHMNKSFVHVRPLNYIDYRLETAIEELKDFCGFQYYGGKHYESILCRFMQCYYLPVKFGRDKRKSHLSSLIMSNQMTREEALQLLKKPLYVDDNMLDKDKEFLAKYMNITLGELEELIALPPQFERVYPHSRLNELAPIARCFRRFLD